MQTEMGRIAGLLKETPDEPTPLQRELDRTGQDAGSSSSRSPIVMIVTIVVVEDVRGRSGAVRRAHPRRGACGCRRAGGAPGRRHGGALDWRAAHGAAECDRAAPGGRRDAGIGQRHRVRQDRHAHQERDDGAGRGHGQRASHVRGLWLRARSGDVRSATAAELSTVRSAWNSSARSPSPIAPTTPRSRSAMAGGRCRAIRPKARCSSPRARLARSRGARRATAARRRGAVLVRAEADEHASPRHASSAIAASSSPRARRTCCWRAARANSSARSGDR